ncbi:hypothetical protein JOC45_002282 [Gordonia hydrophobica]|nr:hypothetical protein [Gordonia hydrophobica]
MKIDQPADDAVELGSVAGHEKYPMQVPVDPGHYRRRCQRGVGRSPARSDEMERDLGHGLCFETLDPPCCGTGSGRRAVHDRMEPTAIIVRRDDRVHERCHQLVQGRRIRPSFDENRPDGTCCFIDVSGGEGFEERCLVGEVLVEAADRIPGARCDPIRRCGQTLAIEHLRSCFEKHIHGLPRPLLSR